MAMMMMMMVATIITIMMITMMKIKMKITTVAMKIIIIIIIIIIITMMMMMTVVAVTGPPLASHKAATQPTHHTQPTRGRIQHFLDSVGDIQFPVVPARPSEIFQEPTRSILSCALFCYSVHIAIQIV